MGCDPRSERSMIARRRWVSVTLPSGLRQVPDPSGPRQLIRRPILSTSSGSAVAPRPYAKMPPIPHIVRLPATRHRAVGRPFDWAHHGGPEAWASSYNTMYQSVQTPEPVSGNRLLRVAPPRHVDRVWSRTHPVSRSTSLTPMRGDVTARSPS